MARSRMQACISLKMLFTLVGAFDTSTVKVPGIGDVVGNVLSDGTWAGLGIPFAAPPIGQNRFRPPQPKQYNSRVLNATNFGPACIQVAMTGDVGETSEDCLTLNIWSPPSRGKELLPVYFWIHGGGFLEGSGKLYNGSALSKLGVVVVTINYRLGPLGWFASDEIAKENPDSPGNGAVHGFLDQLTALRWVHEHIASFGGDARKITIGGESAGSLSTCVHLHLPVSKGLFRRAILESGVCVAGAPWMAGFNVSASHEHSEGLAKSVNATDLASLRRVKVEELVKSPLWPTVTPAPDGFYMPKSTTELPVATRGIDVMVGANTMDTLNAPPYLGITGLPDVTPKNASALRNLASDYFGHEIFSLYEMPALDASEKEVQEVFYRMGGDVCNACPKHWAASKFVMAHENVFVYEFGYSTAPFKGLACHGCEIADAFNVSIAAAGAVDKMLQNSYNAHLGDKMVHYWANFVKTGIPADGASWPKYKGSIGTSESLRVGTTAKGEPRITVELGLDDQRCEFFDKFWKKSSSNAAKYSNFCNSPVPLTQSGAEVTIVV